MSYRIYLSPPHIGHEEQRYMKFAIDSNWIAPVGPFIGRFEKKVADESWTQEAVALSSGTAALAMAMRAVGVGPGDEVFCSDLTFIASVSPAVQLGAEPVFIDSQRVSWNMDPNRLEEALKDRAKRGKKPAAVVVVHLYGGSASMGRIVWLCEKYGVPLIEDAAQALGATHQGTPVGGIGHIGVFSFNGNKIITTSGGGMLVTNDQGIAANVRRWSSHAREPVPHYEHRELGTNYRLSNLLAAIGVAQMGKLHDRVGARRENLEHYKELMEEVYFQPDALWGMHTRWMSVALFESRHQRERVRLALEGEGIESRPVWKPLHEQPALEGAEFFGEGVSRDLYERGLCLPSGSNLTPGNREEVAHIVTQAL